MNAMLILNIVLFGVTIFMITRIFKMNKRNKKGKALIAIVNALRDKEEFFAKANEMIANSDEEFQNKARVLKLWGIAYHQEFKEFDDVLNSIDMDKLMEKNNNGNVSIVMDEDSFFYMYLAIPNLLEGDHRRDLRLKVDEKMAPYGEMLANQMCKAIHDELNTFYDHTGDRGMEFYKKILSGDYKDLVYAKSMIGLYKNIVNAHLAVLYKEAGDVEKYAECETMLEDFSEYGVGDRWLKVLKLTVRKHTEDEDADSETFKIINDSAAKQDDKDTKETEE